MPTTSYGYYKPANNDTGDVFFPAMATNIQQLNDHNHGGEDSAFLATTTQSILSGFWTAAPIGGGLYVQTITMPSGLNYDTADVWFRLSSGEPVYPSLSRVSSTQYKVYTNDNSLNYTALYR